MKSKFMLSLLAAMIAVVVAGSRSPAFAQTSAAATAASRWAGSWEGKLEGLPSVVLRISESGEAVDGQVSFNIIKRVAGGSPAIAGTMTVPMVNPRIQGNDLAFQVVREDRNGNPGKRAVLNFTLVLTGDRSARLERAAGPENALEVDMLRRLE
jgi:hypothetical protein